jgi:hypothetical protein
MPVKTLTKIVRFRMTETGEDKYTRALREVEAMTGEEFAALQQRYRDSRKQEKEEKER